MWKRVLLSLLYPSLLVILSIRLAFSEPFVEFLYSRIELPPDPMSYEVRLSIAKLGLRSVLSEEGMREFVQSGLFNQREIKHMEDVKSLLSLFFTFLYIALPFWFFIFLRLRGWKERGMVLISGGLLLEGFALFVLFASIVSYEWIFEAFHNLFFDPYSWRFREEDMLLRVYPMDFWFWATVYTALGVFIVNAFLQALGFLLWRKSV